MRKNKTISFNEDDVHELELLQHAEKVNPLTGKAQNFSKYVKRLIDADMRQIQSPRIAQAAYEVEIVDERENELKEAMHSFL